MIKRNRRILLLWLVENKKNFNIEGQLSTDWSLYQKTSFVPYTRRYLCCLETIYCHHNDILLIFFWSHSVLSFLWKIGRPASGFVLCKLSRIKVFDHFLRKYENNCLTKTKHFIQEAKKFQGMSLTLRKSRKATGKTKYLRTKTPHVLVCSSIF